MSSPEVASLVRELANIRRELRDLAIGNPLNNAEVVDASGNSVTLSQLAFGSVPGTILDAAVLYNATPASPGGVGWFAWGPDVWVRVTGGKLRVDVAAALVAQGNKASTYMSYALYGPAETSGGTAALHTEPAYDRSVELFDPGYGQGLRLAAGTFGLHTGLTPGWYRVAAQYAMSFSGGVHTYGEVSNRRVLATPF